MDACPNSTESGCFCAQHHPGLAAYARDPEAYAAALKPLQPTRLRIVTMPDEQVHDPASMTCQCTDCQTERSQPRKRGELADHQPWHPRNRAA